MDVTLSIIQDSMNFRFGFIESVLLDLSERDLNAQPLKNKKTIAEIINHILWADLLPYRPCMVFYRTLDVLFRSIKKATTKPIDASDTTWNISTTNTWKPKFVAKTQLEHKFRKAQEYRLHFMKDRKESQSDLLWMVERHANSHVNQIRILLEKLE